MQWIEARKRTAPRVEKQPLMTTPFVLVMLSTLAYFVSVGALLPTLPRYVEGPLGGGETAVGIAIGSFALSAVLIRPFIGTVGDRRGRRVLIVAGAALVALSVAAYTVASSLLTLLLLRLLSGAGEAAFYVGAASVINDLAPDERRGEALSLFSLALYGGLAVGPILGESVLGDSRYTLTWLVAASAAAIAALLGLKVPETRPESRLVRPRQRGVRRIVHPAGLLPGLIMACSVWGLAGFNTFVPLYALDLSLDGSRLVFVVYSVIVLGIRSFGARIPDRYGPARTARIALAISGLGLGIIGLWAEPAGLFAGAALFAVGQALTFPALMTIAVTSAPAAERSAVIGTFTSFFDLAFGAGAVALGGVAELVGYGGTFLSAAGVAAAGVVLLLVRAQKRRTTLAEEMAEAA
ncbi:MFS transporter [soil metagenome]